MLRTAAVHSINSAELRRNRGLPSMNIQVATNCSISQDENGIATLNLPWLCRWFRVEQTRFEGSRKKSKISNAYFRAKFSTFCFTIVYYQEDKIEMPKASNKWFVRLLLCWPWRGKGLLAFLLVKRKPSGKIPTFAAYSDVVPWKRWRTDSMQLANEKEQDHYNEVNFPHLLMKTLSSSSSCNSFVTSRHNWNMRRFHFRNDTAT